MSLMTYLTSRSLLAALALPSSLRLRAPKARTSHPLTTTPSSALGDKTRSQSTSTTRFKGQKLPPPSAHHSRSKRSHRTADRSSSVLRQQHYSESSESSQKSPSSSSREKRPLLQPYELSRRLIALCERGDVDLAVTALQRAPRNAQNIKVWNTIIQQCMGAKKYKLAYSVFTDMKRRGFMPNVRTYATMMSGYATVDDWSLFKAQLGWVHIIYRQLKQHLKETHNLIDGRAGESNASFILYPIALYISILGKAGKYRKAFDVFHELDMDGPLAPHPKVYSCLLSALANRVDATDVGEEDIENSVSEAKYTWRRHMRSLDKQPQHYIEPRSVEAMIKLLSRTPKISDHLLMFDILRDICGLPGPDHPPRPPVQKKVELTSWILNEILDGCLVAGRPDMAVHYAQSVMDNRVLRPILRARHLRKLLSAHITLAKNGLASPSGAENVAAWVEWMVAQDPARESEITTPNEQTVVCALEFCDRSKDMRSALRIARVMTSDRSQGSIGKRGASFLSRPSFPVKAWEHLFHLATEAGQDEKRQCFELFNSYGPTRSQVLDVWESTSAIDRLAPIEKKTHMSLARLVVRVFETVLPASDHEGAEKPDAADLEAWSDIRKRAKSFLEKPVRRKS